MLRGEREYDLLHLLFCCCSRTLEGHTHSVACGRVEAARLEQDGSEKRAGGVWCIPLGVLLHNNLGIA